MTIQLFQIIIKMKLICAMLLFVGVRGIEEIDGDLARDSGDDKHVGDVPEEEAVSDQADDSRWMVQEGCLALKMSAEVTWFIKLLIMA